MYILNQLSANEWICELQKGEGRSAFTTQCFKGTIDEVFAQIQAHGPRCPLTLIVNHLGFGASLA